MGSNDLRRGVAVVYISEALLINRPRGPDGDERMYTSGGLCAGCVCVCDCRTLGTMPFPWLADLVEGSGVAVRLAFLDTPGNIGVVTPGWMG